MKTVKIFDDAKDKNVAVTVIYFNATDEKYYYVADAEKQDSKTEVPATDLFDLFVKGVVCVNDDVYYTAKSYDETNGIDFGFPAEDDDSHAEG